MDWVPWLKFTYYVVSAGLLVFGTIALAAGQYRPALISLVVAGPAVGVFVYKRVYMPGPILP